MAVHAGGLRGRGSRTRGLSVGLTELAGRLQVLGLQKGEDGVLW